MPSQRTEKRLINQKKLDLHAPTKEPTIGFDVFVCTRETEQLFDRE